MLEPAEQHLRFGPFEIDASSGELRREGVVVPLAPQPFRLLAALAARPGQVLTRDELRRLVWGEETFVDFERGLNFCVLQVRAALGDDARNPTYVETLPKRGYRFIGSQAPTRPAAATPAAARPRWQVALIAAALSITLVIAWQHRA